MKLSIITVNKDNCSGLKKTVESVLNQTIGRSDFEYIVVDGASSDGSAEYLQVCTERIDKWVSEPDKGIYSAMNKGVQMASAEYVLFLNSGDTFHASNSLELCMPFLDASDFVVGKMMFLDAEHNLMTPPEQPTLLHFYKHSLPHSASFIRRELLLRNPYDEKLRIVSDWKFFLDEIALKNGSYKTVDVVVSDFDCSGISSQNRQACDTEKAKVLTDLVPKRVLLDYRHFVDGAGYSDTDYDNFYVRIRVSRFGKLFYKLNRLVLKCFSLVNKNAKAILQSLSDVV